MGGGGGYFLVCRLGREGTLIVDGQEVTGSSKGPLQVLNVQGNLFFGIFSFYFSFFFFFLF
jgi:hypothetical protein